MGVFWIVGIILYIVHTPDDIETERAGLILMLIALGATIRFPFTEHGQLFGTQMKQVIAYLASSILIKELVYISLLATVAVIIAFTLYPP